MQIIRTIVWIVITALLVAFIAMNWDRAPVNIWPTESGYLHFEWPVGIIALVFFLIGLVPMWLLARAGRWRMTRRISSLENTVRANTIAATPAPVPVPPPAPATATDSLAAEPAQTASTDNTDGK